MFDDSHSFIARAFLRAVFDLDYRAYTDDRDAELLRRLRDWDGRLLLNETQAEGALRRPSSLTLGRMAKRVACDRRVTRQLLNSPSLVRAQAEARARPTSHLVGFVAVEMRSPKFYANLRIFGLGSTRNRTEKGARAAQSNSV
jgi:hypothetical protein